MARGPVTVSAGTGIAYFYTSSAGGLTVGIQSDGKLFDGMHSPAE